MRVRFFGVAPAVVLAFAAMPVQAAVFDAVPASRWIVVLRDDAAVTPDAAATAVRRLGGTVTNVYRSALHGYAASLPSALVAALRLDPSVAFVEPDGVMRADTTQTGATWGLDRIDQRARPVDGAYHYTATGSGVTAYVIDTGIRFSHAQFGGRAVSGYDAVDGGAADDCNGHGTHVSGTIGGSTYGVAKAVRLVAVRVLDCGGSGATSGVVAGIDWVTANHVAGTPAVANMSLGGGASAALDAAVRNSIADGVTYAIAAGNGNALGFAEDACGTSPARVTEALTIGATDSTDKKASWSNYGTCVDWFAPGVSITSSWYSSDTATNTISGTSMATPHTAGVAALYLQGVPGASPAAVRAALDAKLTQNVVTGAGSGGLLGGGTYTNNDLLFSDF